MSKLFLNSHSSEKPSKLNLAYVPNRTARITAEPHVVLDLLVEQMDNAVLWKQSVEALLQAGFSKAIEFGPGKVLQGLAKRIAKSANKELEVKTIGTTADLNLL